MQKKVLKVCNLKGEKAVEFGDGNYEDAFVTDSLKGGLLKVPARGKAGYDAGHIEKDEMFFVIKGEAYVEFPTLQDGVDIKEGGFLLVPKNEPHVVSNQCDEELVLLYANCDV